MDKWIDGRITIAFFVVIESYIFIIIHHTRIYILLYIACCTQKTQTLAIEKGISLVVHSNSSVTDIQRVNETQMRILWTDLSIGNHGGVELVVDAALLCTG